MAVFTTLNDTDAARICSAHDLGTCRAIEPIEAGSVNSNYFLRTDKARVFLRVYEEQREDGVRYEWALLDHLAESGLPIARRIPGPPPGHLRVAGKPVAVFEALAGTHSCQAAVTPPRAHAVGELLARAHLACASFPQRRAGRFGTQEVRQRLERIDPAEHPDLAPTVRALVEVLDEAERALPADLPRGVIHGDLFRDNVLWDDDRITGVLDWESASDGVLAFDVVVAILAWCFDDDFRWDLARALCRGYTGLRRFDGEERRALGPLALQASVRFTTTRITDFHLRSALGARVHKDYRRFLARLHAIRSLEREELCSRLGV